MATTVDLTDLTNGTLVDNTWVGAGVFDKLMAAVSSNIDGQYNLGRIKGTDYANVYLGGIQSVLAQSVTFLLQQGAAGAIIDKAKAEAETAKALATESQAKALAEIIKVYGFGNATMDASTHEIIVGSNTADGKLDYENNLVKEQIDTEDLKNKTDGLLENQILATKKDIDIKERSTVISEAQSVKDLLLKAEQVTKTQEEVDLLQSQDSELLLNGAKDRIIKDEQLKATRIKEAISLLVEGKMDDVTDAEYSRKLKAVYHTVLTSLGV